MFRDRKTLLILAIILAVGGAIAITFSSVSPASSPATSELGIPFDEIGPQPTPTSYVSNIGGFITAVGNATLTISTFAPGGKAPVVTKVAVAVGSDTSIFKEISKDQVAYKKEQAAYIAKHDYSYPPPLPYTKTPLTLSDLKPEMLVNIKLAEPTSEGAAMHALEIGVLPIQPKYPTPSASQ